MPTTNDIPTFFFVSTRVLNAGRYIFHPSQFLYTKCLYSYSNKPWPCCLRKLVSKGCCCNIQQPQRDGFEKLIFVLHLELMFGNQHSGGRFIMTVCSDNLHIIVHKHICFLDSMAGSCFHGLRLRMSKSKPLPDPSSSSKGRLESDTENMERKRFNSTESWSMILDSMDTWEASKEEQEGEQDEWTADLSQLFLGNKFASGAHSRIYRGVYKQRAVAVKMVRMPSQDEETKALLEEQFNSEVALLSRLFHFNIVQVWCFSERISLLSVYVSITIILSVRIWNSEGVSKRRANIYRFGCSHKETLPLATSGKVLVFLGKTVSETKRRQTGTFTI